MIIHFSLHIPPTLETYTLSLHDALPILLKATVLNQLGNPMKNVNVTFTAPASGASASLGGLQISNVLTDLSRSEEHTSELQSLTNLVCRLPLEKKNIV